MDELNFGPFIHCEALLACLPHKGHYMPVGTCPHMCMNREAGE